MDVKVPLDDLRVGNRGMEFNVPVAVVDEYLGIKGVSVGDMSSEQATLLFQRDQVPEYKLVEGDMAEIRRRAQVMAELMDRYEKSAEEATRSMVNASADKALTEVQAFAAAVKVRLDKRKEENNLFLQEFHDAANSANWQMRHNIYNSMTRKFQAAMNEFQVQHQLYVESVKSAQRRRIKNLDVSKTLSDEKINALVENGHADELLAQGFISDDLQDCIQDIEQRHASVLKLEESVRGLFTLFQDIATLVDVQQESLDIIGEHITKSKGYAEKGARHLVEAEKHQTCARKGACCIAVIFIIILCTMLPLFIKSA